MIYCRKQKIGSRNLLPIRLFFVFNNCFYGFCDILVVNVSGFKMYHFESCVHDHSHTENGDNGSDADSCAHKPGNGKNDNADNIVDCSDGKFFAAFAHRNGKSISRSAAEPGYHIHILTNAQDKKAYHEKDEFYDKRIKFRDRIQHRKKIASQSNTDRIDKGAHAYGLFHQNIHQNNGKTDGDAGGAVGYGKDD